ncbi:MAG: class I SAM-dependent methyltransferase [Bacteroidota bacterium]
MILPAARFLSHQWRARGAYRVHSPFVYEFVTQVLPHRNSEWGDRIEARRRELSRDRQTRLEIADYGAGYGGKAHPRMTKRMDQVVRSSARRRKEGELLHRICAHYRPEVCLEFGTNLGFSGLYQASAVPESRFISLEGAPSLAGVARQHFARFGLEVDLRVGEFSAQLERLPPAPDLQFDYVLLDGNHRYAPTVAYFTQLLPRMADRSIVVLDDINWSEGMQAAWREIAAHPQVSVSLDLYFLGIAFIRRPQRKQHFYLRFSSW